MTRPIGGLANAAISKAPEKAPNTHELGTRMAALIGSAKIAGKL